MPQANVMNMMKRYGTDFSFLPLFLHLPRYVDGENKKIVRRASVGRSKWSGANSIFPQWQLLGLLR